MTRHDALFGRLFLYGRGRLAAALILAVFAVLLAAGNLRARIDTPQIPVQQVLFAVTAPLASVQQWLFDAYQRLLPRKRQGQPVAVVAIDENSLKALGQWPWPRSQVAALVDAIARHDPAAIGLDVYMPEADQSSPERVADRLDSNQAGLADALRRLPPYDVRLARSLRDAPTVLGAAGFKFSTYSTREGMRTVPIEVRGGDALAFLHNFPFVLTSLPELQVAAHGQALLTVREDTVVRRIPLVASIGPVPAPSLAMEMLRVASDSSAIELDVDRHGVRTVRVAELSVPTQASGDVWLHFAPGEAGAQLRNISAVQLLAGKVSGDALEKKLVLVGLTGTGLNDWRTTPLRESVPGIEIQAQLLESLLDGRMLLRPWWMPYSELALLLALGLAMIVWIPGALARRDALGGSRPRRVGAGVSFVCLMLLVSGIVLFHVQGWLFDGAGMSIAFATMLAGLVSSSTLEVERDNRRLAALEHDLREDAARLAGEMEAARRIQLGSLPDARTAFAGEQRFAIGALLEPAREVGGDLFDFFMVDERRLCFLIGDVSGKGVPASLFMAVTKTLARSFAMRLAGGPSAVVSAANLDLSRGNVETLFVTMLLGVLDVQTGALELVNAGHDSPWLRGPGRPPRQVNAPEQEGGPPLCVLDDFIYTVQHLQLVPGDDLVMTTDGITEAANTAAELYGSARLRAALAAIDDAAPVESIVQRLRSDVADFVDGAEASDDLAILVVRWNGSVEPTGETAGT